MSIRPQCRNCGGSERNTECAQCLRIIYSSGGGGCPFHSSTRES